VSELRVVRVEALNGTPAATLAVKGWLELQEKGFSDGSLNMLGNMHAFVGYAENGRDMLPVGVITFTVEIARLWIHQSYVLPEFRGRGVYSAMWAELVSHVTLNLPNIREITSAAHAKNQAMRAIAKRQGRVEEAVILRLDIPRS
jgi:RimJ/RimL family protein N-acetyltransferase